ncbi:MAG: hypothetical protein HY296_02790 [Thaumarchaeota archaeon]|nr:hypothetical protein [Nitrososphaerota archaeon]
MNAFCISHVKDVDGVGAAAIVKAATGARVMLSDYDTLMEDLDRIPKETEQFFLCDLGSDNSNVDQFLEKLKSISRRAKVTYVDHHFMSGATKRRLRSSGVRLVHDVKECSSILAYLTLKESLPAGASLVALYGAVTDYADGSPNARVLMERADRQFVLFEAAMLAFALGRKGAAGGFPELVVDELSRMKHPHEIEGVPRLAVEQLEKVRELEDEVRSKGKRSGKLAYMVTGQYSTGNVSKLLIGAFGVRVGVALKEKSPGWYEVSLRGTSECKAHLGRTIDRISAKLGGNGGGHKVAAGCRIPVGRMDDMLTELEKKI